MESSSILLISTTLVITAAMAIVFTFFIQRSIVIRSRYSREQLWEDLDKHSKVLNDSIAEKKKREIQSTGLKTFYYLDESQIKDLYPQIAGGITAEQIQTKRLKGSKKGISAKLKIVEPEYHQEAADEKTTTYSVKQHLSLQYNEIERYLFDKSQVTFALEDFESDEALIQQAENTVNEIRDSGLDIPEETMRRLLAKKMEKLASQNIKRLENASGYIAIKCEVIAMNTEETEYQRLQYEHPLSKYLSQEENKAAIQINCAKESITPSGCNAFAKHKRAKITCLGKVLSWDPNTNTLQISPIAIY
ncbi:MAG: hypothetical protein FJ023_00420 [Chloroflexi bacterium]|nr:hypothetical protein [Chloroflexota bacterium]